MLDIIKSRRSVRRFQDKPIPPDVIQDLLEAARWAPSGSNSQPWAFLVIQEPAHLRKVKLFSPGLGGDPVALLILCSDQSIEASTAIMDVSMATQNGMLVATEIGLGSCCVRSLNQEPLQLLLKLPPHMVPELTIALGYPAESPKPPRRRPIEEMVHREEYGEQPNEQ